MTWYRWRWGRLARAEKPMRVVEEDGRAWQFGYAREIFQGNVTWKHIGLGLYWASKS